MLLFKKKDLLVVISKSGETVQFTKPLKDILKYQYRYNYKFKLYENGKVTTAEDYIIDGETLTVLFGSATITYNSEGASYTEGSGGSGGGSDGKQLVITITQNGDTPVFTPNITYAEMSDITGGLAKVFMDTDTYMVYKLAHWISYTESYELYFISANTSSEPIFIHFYYNADGSISAPK